MACGLFEGKHLKIWSSSEQNQVTLAGDYVLNEASKDTNKGVLIVITDDELNYNKVS